jgi:hypothetical protein
MNVAPANVLAICCETQLLLTMMPNQPWSENWYSGWSRFLTIKRLEAHDGALVGRHETGTRIRLALETAGVEFIDENGGGPGVRLRKHQNKR